MLEWHAREGAMDHDRIRNVVILQHYPGACEALARRFRGAEPEKAARLDVRCFFGHTHSTQCKSPRGAKPTDDCNFAMLVRLPCDRRATAVRSPCDHHASTRTE